MCDAKPAVFVVDDDLSVKADDVLASAIRAAISRS